MPRARCPDSIEAERLWNEEKLLLKDIAAKLGVPEGTVRRWKNTQDWEGKKSKRSGKPKANVRKRGSARFFRESRPVPRKRPKTEIAAVAALRKKEKWRRSR